MVGRTLYVPLTGLILTVFPFPHPGLNFGSPEPSFPVRNGLFAYEAIHFVQLDRLWLYSSSRVTVQKIQLHQSESNRSLLAAATAKGNRPEEQRGIGVPSDQIFTPECVSSVCDRNPDEGIQASDSGTSSAA